MDLTARWLCSKYSKKGKRYFTSLAHKGYTFVKRGLLKLRWMWTNIETWNKSDLDERRQG